MRTIRIGVAIACCAVALGAQAGVASARTSPPPVPACFSQAGICYGVPLKSVIAGQKVFGGANGLFKLTGPAPLQFTKPVACGDLGCIYNHLNWTVGPGGTVTSGCAVNTTRCSVSVPSGASEWVPVVVTQNDYPAALFLLWASPCRGGAPDIGGRLRFDSRRSARVANSALCPVQTPPKVLSTQQRKDELGSAAYRFDQYAQNVEVETGVNLGTGVVAVVATVIAGPAAGVFGLVSLYMAYLCHQEAIRAQQLAQQVREQRAKDPPVGGFTRVARPLFAPVHLLPAPRGRPALARLARAANLELQNHSTLAGVVGATVTTLDRSTGARRAHNHRAYELQKAALVRYLNEEATLLVQDVTLRKRLLTALRATGVPLTLTAQQVQTVTAYVAAHWTTSLVSGTLRRAGLNPNGLMLSKSRVLSSLGAAGLDLSSVLSSAPLDASERQLEVGLRTAANTIKRLP